MAERTLAEGIRDEREWLGLSRAQVAERLGVGVSVVEAWEFGELAPSDVQLERLAKLFGLSLERLHGAPLVDDTGHAILCGSRGRLSHEDLSHEDRYHAARFAEFLRHTGRPRPGNETGADRG